MLEVLLCSAVARANGSVTSPICIIDRYRSVDVALCAIVFNRL